MRRRQLFLAGLSHHKAPIEIREKVAVASDELEEVLCGLRSRRGVEEVFLVSTCNRLEIYAATSSEEGAAAIRAFFDARAPDAAGHLYEAWDLEAVRHLFRVCSSLESMVIGESQILGQVKEALATAERAGTMGGLLARVCQRALSVAKRVRTETRIGASAVSMGSAGVEVARKILGPLHGRSALILGAGEIAALAGRSLAASGCSELHIVNRSLERGESLAAEIGATAHPWESLPEFLVRCDLVVCSTAAQAPVITLEAVQAARRRRRHRPLLFIDLALPRDVDPRVGGLDEVYLFDVDDLDRVLEENRAAREREAALALGLVEQEARAFYTALRSEAEPLLKELHQRAEEIVHAEVAKTLARHEIDPALREAVEALGRAISKKLLHLPTARIRQAGLADDGALLGAAAALFALSPRAADLPVPGDRPAPPPGQNDATETAPAEEEEASTVLARLVLSRSGGS